jgi:hypothetical protein
MLTRLLRLAAVAAAAAMALVCLAQVPALAGGGPGGPFGHTQCGQSSSPQCTVTAGTGLVTGTPGTVSTGGGGTTGGGTATVATGGTAAGGCSGTMNATFGCVPAGCNITVQTLACPIGVGGAAPPPPGGGPAPVLPAPGVLAQLAVKYLRLPDPVIRSSPAPGALQLTRLPVWLWIAAGDWEPQSKTAQVPGESVTATATPVSAAWDMGNGTTVTCKGPGTPYGDGNPAAASPTCGYTYDQSSAGQPGGAYPVTVTITWDITWAGDGGAGGVLAPLQTVAAAEFQVAESQALDTSSGG